MDNSNCPPSVCVVSVTYGQRWNLLRQALASAKNDGVERAVVVDNGAKVNIAELAQQEFGDFVDVVTMGRNTGSAGGFKAGMQRALDLGAEYILLLDDDNELQSGCLTTLAATHEECSKRVPADRLAVLAYRSNWQTEVARNVPSNGMEGNRAAFLGFDFLDVPFKLFRRTPMGRKWIANRPMLNQVSVAIAPYSGMYFHRSVPEKHGLPDERFFLYADDSDFSYRLTCSKGQIVLATNAKLVDLELSWNMKARFSNTLDALLLGDGDFRAFYSTRNHAYFEGYRHASRRDKIIRSINRAMYLTALRARAVMVGRKERLNLLLRAVQDGEAGRLGEHADYTI
jgi:GT2 family glycosyltransferase